MKYKEKEVFLKNGEKCLLRSPEPDEAEAVIAEMRQTSGETANMARYADEIKLTVGEERAYLEEVLKNPLSCLIAAYADGRLIATAGITPVRELDKYRHRAGFGMSVLEKYWHIGVGSALMEACIEAARGAGYELLELEAVKSNIRAVALYERFGFKTYGVRPRGFRFRDGTYADETLMSLEL